MLYKVSICGHAIESRVPMRTFRLSVAEQRCDKVLVKCVCKQNKINYLCRSVIVAILYQTKRIPFLASDIN